MVGVCGDVGLRYANPTYATYNASKTAPGKPSTVPSIVSNITSRRSQRLRCELQAANSKAAATPLSEIPTSVMAVLPSLFLSSLLSSFSNY
jgi:hypothetical protein